jgi:D-alanyl-D-alanine carboxypeptidase
MDTIDNLTFVIHDFAFGKINAPINTDRKVGDLVITHNGKEIARTAVYSSKNVNEGGLFKRGMDSIKMYFE